MAASQGVHIIEGMIQLLADSLVFQFLSVQLICKWEWQRRKQGEGVQSQMQARAEEKERNEREQINY